VETENTLAGIPDTTPEVRVRMDVVFSAFLRNAVRKSGQSDKLRRALTSFSYNTQRDRTRRKPRFSPCAIFVGADPAITVAELDGVRIYVLGPPHDDQKINR
jgi:hypothetical protein